MTSAADNLERLVSIGQLKKEKRRREEFEGLVRSGESRLEDAAKQTLSLESRFDLAYNAAHALSLAALRWHGYRPANRYVAFQALEHTLALPASRWRVLAKCHELRNRAEYEGIVELDESLLRDAIEVTYEVLGALSELEQE